LAEKNRWARGTDPVGREGEQSSREFKEEGESTAVKFGHDCAFRGHEAREKNITKVRRERGKEGGKKFYAG